MGYVSLGFHVVLEIHRSAFWCILRARCYKIGAYIHGTIDVLFHEVTPPTRGCYPGLPSKAPNNFK